MAGLFVAAGLNSQGIIFGPGVGRALAEWIDEGAPTIDAAEVDVRRFAPAQANARYLFERTRERSAGSTPCTGPSCSPRPRAACGACRSTTVSPRPAPASARPPAGSARTGSRRPASEPVYRYSYGRQNWFDAVGEEHRAAREAVALFDLSSFAKLRVEGPTALATVQRVFTADLDRPPGAWSTPAC